MAEPDPGIRAAVDLLMHSLDEELELLGGGVDDVVETTLVIRGASGGGFKLRLIMETFEPSSQQLEVA